MGTSCREGTYTITVPDTLTCMPYNRQSDYIVHPISLDVVFQGATMFLAEDPNESEAYMPVSVREITVAVGMVQDPGSVFQIHATSIARDAFSRRRSFDYVALDMQRASCPSGIVATGVVEAPVQGSEVVQAGSESRCLRTQWEPSMSYLDQGDLEAMLSLPPPGLYDLQASRKLKEMGLDYIKQALRETNVDEMPATYVRKLYAWMEAKVHEPNHDVTKSETRLESADHFINGIKEDVNGDISVKAEGNVFNSKADQSNGVVEVNIKSNDAMKGRAHNEQLLSEHQPKRDVPFNKGHNEPNGILPKEQGLESNVSDVGRRNELIEDHSQTSNTHAESTQLAMLLMRRVGAQLPAILRGQIDPAVLMSEDDLLSRFTAEFEGMSRLYKAAGTYIQKLAFQCPVLRILEVGGLDRLATARILEGLSTGFGISSGSIQYEILEESTDVLAKLALWTHLLKQRKFDPTKSLSSQDLEEESYDVIITADSYILRDNKKLTDVRSLLKTGGKLILFQTRHDRDSTSLLPLATLPSWWAEDRDDCDRNANRKTNIDLTFIP